MTSIIKLVLCCLKYRETVDKQSAHHTRTLTADLSACHDLVAEVLDSPLPPALEDHEPAASDEPRLPSHSEEERKSAVEAEAAVRPQTDTKKHTGGRKRRKSLNGQDEEGRHEPLPREARPSRSILKKR